MAAVHKAGEERRCGTTPATATPLTSSWKARDPVRRKARPLRVSGKKKNDRRAKAVTAKRVSAAGPELKFMFVRMSGASEGRGAIRGKARGPAVGAKRRLPRPGKTKVTSAGGSRLSPQSGRQARPGGVEGAPAGRTGAGVNRPTGRREALHHGGRLQPRGRAGEYRGGGGAQSR